MRQTPSGWTDSARCTRCRGLKRRQISGACEGIANIGYIRASGFEGPFGQFYAKAGERRWWQEELVCGHDVMLDMPNELTALLLRRM
jgi:hypothetical protein